MKQILLFVLLAGFLFQPWLTAQVTDVDGNQYPTVVIGSQEWMAENLRTSRLNDSTPISYIAANASWFQAAEPAMCWYNNDSATHHWPYGRLYNGYAAQLPNICPDGWAVPTTNEWDQMITYLGGSSVAGGKMKHAGFDYWEQPNEGATNSSGFTGLPGGYRSQTDGAFQYKGQRGGWLVLMGNEVAFRFLSWSIEASGTGLVQLTAGLSIRCFRPASSTEEPTGPTEHIKVFPIPSKGLINIEIINQTTPFTEHKIVISDITGRTIVEVPVQQQETVIDISDRPEGLYILKVFAGDVQVDTRKIVKQN